MPEELPLVPVVLPEALLPWLSAAAMTADMLPGELIATAGARPLAVATFAVGAEPGAPGVSTIGADPEAVVMGTGGEPGGPATAAVEAEPGGPGINTTGEDVCEVPAVETVSMSG